MSDQDAWDVFILGIDVTELESERFGPTLSRAEFVKRVLRESFGRPKHGYMLARHEVARERFRVEQAFVGFAGRLELLEQHWANRRADKPQILKTRNSPAPKVTAPPRDRLLEIAIAALERQEHAA